MKMSYYVSALLVAARKNRPSVPMVGDRTPNGVVLAVDGPLVTVSGPDSLVKAPPGTLTSTCRWCGETIEFANGAWWKQGTCGSRCLGSTGPGITHAPAGPPIGDRIALERWLDS